MEGSPKSIVGDFNCSNCDLETLRGGSKSVGGTFDCSGNKLTTLAGYPEVVGGVFYCNCNKLTTLLGPEQVDGNFYFDDNPVYDLYRLFNIGYSCLNNYNRFKSSLDFGYLRGTDIVKSRFILACQEAGIKMPEKIEGYNYI